MILQSYTDRPALVMQFGKMFTAKKPSAGMAAWLQGLGFDASSIGTFKALEALRTEDLRADLSAIRVPTAIFSGVKDEICPWELAEETHRAIPGSTLERFEESGHALLFDEPERFSEKLTAFLAGAVEPEPVVVDVDQTLIV